MHAVPAADGAPLVQGRPGLPGRHGLRQRDHGRKIRHAACAQVLGDDVVGRSCGGMCNLNQAKAVYQRAQNDLALGSFLNLGKKRRKHVDKCVWY